MLSLATTNPTCCCPTLGVISWNLAKTCRLSYPPPPFPSSTINVSTVATVPDGLTLQNTLSTIPYSPLAITLLKSRPHLFLLSKERQSGFFRQEGEAQRKLSGFFSTIHLGKVQLRRGQLIFFLLLMMGFGGRILLIFFQFIVEK